MIRSSSVRMRRFRSKKKALLPLFFPKELLVLAWEVELEGRQLGVFVFLKGEDGPGSDMDGGVFGGEDVELDRLIGEGVGD